MKAREPKIRPREAPKVHLGVKFGQIMQIWTLYRVDFRFLADFDTKMRSYGILVAIFGLSEARSIR